MRADGDPIAQALKGEGPLFEQMLDERARELATSPDRPRKTGTTLAVLRLRGGGGARWAVPLAEVARVEELPRIVAVPSLGAGIMGLAIIAGRRCLVIDLDVLAAAAPPRAPTRPGHTVVLRRHGLALVADRADAIAELPPPKPDTMLLADGSVLLDVDRLAAKVIPTGGG